MKKLFLTLFTICIIPLSIFSATYYVSPTGSDEDGSGSIGSPWQTLPYAFSRLTSGDTLYLRGGIYNEKVGAYSTHRDNPTAFVVITQNLNADSELSRITISAYEGENPVISCVKILTNWRKADKNDPYLTVEGVVNPNYENIFWTEFKGEDSYIKEDGEGYLTHVWVFEDNRLLTLCADSAQNHVIVNPHTFHNIGPGSSGQRQKLFDPSRLKRPENYWQDATVMVILGAENTIHIRRISRSSMSESSLTFGSYNGSAQVMPHDLRSTDSYTIRNHPHLLAVPGQYYFTPRKNDKGLYRLYVWPKSENSLAGKIGIAKWSGAFWFLGAGPANTRSYFTFEGLEFVGGGIGSSTSSKGFNHMKVNNCFIHNSPLAGIQIYSSNNISIENTRIYSTPDYSSPHTAGRSLAIGGNNILIDNCDFRDSNRTIFWTTGSDNIRVTNTYFNSSGHHAQGISLYATSEGVGCSNVLVANNVFAINGITPITTHRLGYAVFFGNIFYVRNTEGTGGVRSWSEGVDKHYLLHNTFVADRDKQCYLLMRTNSDAYVYNNILGGGFVAVSGGENNYQRGYNLHMGRLWDQIGYDDSEIVWTSFDPPLISAYIYNSPAMADFSLKRNSPAVYAGTNLGNFISYHGIGAKFPDFNFSTDIAGKSWSSLPSIGCIEYGSFLGIPDDYEAREEPIMPILPEIPIHDNMGDKQNNGIQKTTLILLNNIIKKKDAQAVIKITVAAAGNASVKIYDSKGKEIITLWDGHKDAGEYDLIWAGLDSSGNKAGSGVYMVHMKAGSYKETKKIVVVK